MRMAESESHSVRIRQTCRP